MLKNNRTLKSNLLAMRKYRDEDEYWRIRQFLRQVFQLNERRELSWPVARFDYWRWHGVANLEHFDLRQVIFLWEDPTGQLAAVLNPEGPGEAFFQVHPEFRTPELEQTLLDTAEGCLAVQNPDGKHRLQVWAHASDPLRRDLLRQHGYVQKGAAEHQRQRALDRPIPDPSLPAGYRVRALGDGLELLERCYASGLGFHDGDIRTAVDNRSDPTWYRNIQTAPLYRRDLDIVSIAPDGAVAAFCTVWFDDVNRSGMFEPVATVPDHRRRGLGKAVLYEGLRRLQRMGATQALVGGYSPEANALYASAGFVEYDLLEPWEKVW